MSSSDSKAGEAGGNNALEALGPLGPPEKRVKKRHLSAECKTLVLNVFGMETIENPTVILSELYAKVANETVYLRNF